MVDCYNQLQADLLYLTCSLWQMVQRQYGENVEILSPRKFKFAGGGKEAKIEIQFQRSIPDGGWVLALESNNKVQKLQCVDLLASYPGLLALVFVACSTNVGEGEGLVKLNHVV